MGNCHADAELDSGKMPSLEEMRARHEAIARYRVYIHRAFPTKSRKVVATGLTLSQAKKRQTEENECLKREEPTEYGTFGGPHTHFELENPEECRGLFASAAPAPTEDLPLWAELVPHASSRFPYRAAASTSCNFSRSGSCG